MAGKRSLIDVCFRLPAVDGKKLKINDVPFDKIQSKYNLKDQYYVDPDPRLLPAIREKEIYINLSNEEIAVALSHIAAWQRIIDEERSYGLILEDDIFFESTFAHDLNLLWKELPKNTSEFPDFDLLYLSYREVDRGALKEEFSEHLIRPIKGLWWFSGYVLSYEGAKKLLSLCPVNGPIDLWINLQFTKLNVYASVNSLIFQRNDLPSNNRYSILPILSQIGIQSDKTHYDLQQKKGRNPVFVILQNTEQIDFIETILSMLGYTCCADRWNNFSDVIQRFIDTREPLLFDAYIGLECLTHNYRVLDLMYPDACFIFLSDPNSNSENYLGNPGKSSSPLYEINQQMNQVVQYQSFFEYFKDKNQKLFIMSIGKMTGWSSLCSFLNCQIPKCDFPKASMVSKIPGSKNTSFVEKTISLRNWTYLEHDVTPWIIPKERLLAFGISSSALSNGKQMGCFRKLFKDEFISFDNNNWSLLQESFPSNLAEFIPENFKQSIPNGFTITLDKQKTKLRNYSSASIVTQQSYLFGRFSVVIKPVKVDGIITAFFLHRNDPWQELDIEFLGKDTTKLLLNVYFNPGSDGAGWNFGNRGTPIVVDLGFDAASDFHEYAIEWEPHEIRWFVDDKLIHIRTIWEPTPIPNLPLNVYINLWPSRSEELAGIFPDDMLPVDIHVRSISINSWVPDSIGKKDSKNC